MQKRNVVPDPLGTTGQRLCYLRTQRNLTKAEVGRAIGFSGQAYGFWEEDKHPLGNPALAKLAAFYQVSMPYLLATTTNPFEDTQLPPEWRQLLNYLKREGSTTAR